MIKYRILQRLIVFSLLMCGFIFTIAQLPVIYLYKGKAPGSENWKQKENIYYDTTAAGSGEQFVYNVTNPTLTVFAAAIPNGTAVIICPGGAFHVLGIDNEGYNVAGWLNSIGITAFVLKYRLAESKTDQPLKELGSKLGNFTELDKENASVVPLALADANEAIIYLRSHAGDLKINPKRIGIIGFSAGGTVAAGIGFGYSAASRPDFVAPVYAYLGALTDFNVQPDAPPLFVVAATDDDLGFAPQSIKLYSNWIAAKRSAEIHIFSKGGHGFGIKKQNLPVDQWRYLFRDWLKLQEFL